jgi:hypothetical protein
MKRLLIAVTALIASLALGLATVSATAGAAGGDQAAQVSKKTRKAKKKIPVSITLVVQNTPADTYSPGSVTYSGQVSARKAICFSGRTVTIARNGAAVATAVTNASGAYSTSFNSAAAAGQYTASVPKQVFKKKGKKVKAHNTKKRKKKNIVCLAATTAPVTVP